MYVLMEHIKFFIFINIFLRIKKVIITFSILEIFFSKMKINVCLNAHISKIVIWKDKFTAWELQFHNKFSCYRLHNTQFVCFSRWHNRTNVLTILGLIMYWCSADNKCHCITYSVGSKKWIYIHTGL